MLTKLLAAYRKAILQGFPGIAVNHSEAAESAALELVKAHVAGLSASLESEKLESKYQHSNVCTINAKCQELLAKVAELCAERDALKADVADLENTLTQEAFGLKRCSDANDVLREKVAELEARLAVQNQCRACGGTGKAGTTPINCPSCRGTGRWP